MTEVEVVAEAMPGRKVHPRATEAATAVRQKGRGLFDCADWSGVSGLLMPLVLQIDDDGRVVGRPLALAGLAINVCITRGAGERFVA